VALHYASDHAWGGVSVGMSAANFSGLRLGPSLLPLHLQPVSARHTHTLVEPSSGSVNPVRFDAASSRCGLRHSDVGEEEADRAAPAEQDSVGPLFESRRAVAAGVVFEAMRERACCPVGADVIEGKA
jgi:hypothetical protein